MDIDPTTTLPAILSLNEFIAGWIGGAGGVLIGHPLDTLKLRMQTVTYAPLFSLSSPPSAKAPPPTNNVSLFKTFTHMLRDEGPRSLYRGMSFPLLSAGVINSIYFGTMQATSRLIGKILPPEHDDNHSQRRRYVTISVAGAVGGATQLSIAVPVEVVKIKLQARTDRIQGQHLTEAFRVCRDIIRKSGVRRGLYRGCSVQATRDIISSSMYFLIYESLLDFFQFYRQNEAKNNVRERTSSILVAGGLAGMISWQIIIPFDVIKSRLQVSDATTCHQPESNVRRWLPYRSLFSAWRGVVREEGWRGLTRGSLPVALRAFPTNAAIFYFYEKSHAYLKTV